MLLDRRDRGLGGGGRCGDRLYAGPADVVCFFAAAASEQPVTRVKKLRSVLHLRCSLEENIAEKAAVARVMFDRGKKLHYFAKGNVRARKAKLFPKVANGSVILCHD